MLNEDAIMLQLRHTNTEFRELEESHHRLDLELNELQRRHVLTPNEEIEKKRIQKRSWSRKTSWQNSFVCIGTNSWSQHGNQLLAIQI